MLTYVADNLTDFGFGRGPYSGHDNIQGVVLLLQLLNIPLQGSLSPVIPVKVVGTLGLVDSNACGASRGGAIALMFSHSFVTFIPIALVSLHSFLPPPAPVGYHRRKEW